MSVACSTKNCLGRSRRGTTPSAVCWFDLVHLTSPSVSSMMRDDSDVDCGSRQRLWDSREILANSRRATGSMLAVSHSQAMAPSENSASRDSMLRSRLIFLFCTVVGACKGPLVGAPLDTHQAAGGASGGSTLGAHPSANGEASGATASLGQGGTATIVNTQSWILSGGAGQTSSSTSAVPVAAGSNANSTGGTSGGANPFGNDTAGKLGAAPDSPAGSGGRFVSSTSAQGGIVATGGTDTRATPCVLDVSSLGACQLR